MVGSAPGLDTIPKLLTLVALLVFGMIGLASAQSGSSLEALKAAAESGIAAAQDQLAEKYILRADMANAEAWYRKAAEQGYAHSQSKLADMLLSRARMSVGLKPEEKTVLADEGLKWAALSASQGDQLGQAKLAEAYWEGKFVNQDLVQAYIWAALGANQPGSAFNPAGVLARSTRDSAILKLSADQLADAKRRVADFTPHQATIRELPVPVWVQQIRLSGLSGSADHRLAIINAKTFGVGESADLKFLGATVQVTCIAITENAAIIRIGGFPNIYKLSDSGQVTALSPPETHPDSAPKPRSARPSAAPPTLSKSPPAVRLNPAPVHSLNSAAAFSPPPRPASLSSFSFWLAIGAAVMFGLFLGTYVTVRREHHQNLGEALVVDTIETSLNQPHLLLNNVTLPTKDGTTQIDHVLVAETGIFVIETKHYSGWIFGRPQDSQWTQQKFRFRTQFQNPLRQNYAHVMALCSLFNLPEDHFHSVVVFTGNAEFKTNPGPEVVRLANLASLLKADRPKLLDERQMAYVIGHIEMHRERRSLETDEYHINHLRTKLGKTTRRPRANPYYTLDPSDKPAAPVPSAPAAAPDSPSPYARYIPPSAAK